MTMESALAGGFSAAATGVRALHSLVSGAAKGDLSALTTITKTSLLAAVNEIKARQSIGYRYTFGMASQPRETWVQANPLTSVFNTATTQCSLSGGTFTFAASTIANVVGNWLFHIDAEATVSADRPVGVEVRVGGVSIGRATAGGNTTSMGVNTRASLTIPYRILGGEVVTYHFIFDYTPLLGSTTSTVNGTIGGVPL